MEKSIDRNQDITSRDATYLRDGLWRFGAFQMSGMGKIQYGAKAKNYATFGGGEGTMVGP